MLNKTKLAVTLAVAIAAMAVSATSAFAVSASVSPGGAVNATGTATFTGGSTSISCPLTLANSLRTGPIVVRAGEELGTTTGVTIGTCTGGNVSGVLNTPWTLRVVQSLPREETLTTRNATGLLLSINNSSFNLSIFGGFVNCLYSGNAGALMPLTATAREETRYTARTLRALETVELALHEGGFGCPSAGHFAGTFTLATTQTVTLS